MTAVLKLGTPGGKKKGENGTDFAFDGTRKKVFGRMSSHAHARHLHKNANEEDKKRGFNHSSPPPTAVYTHGMIAFEDRLPGLGARPCVTLWCQRARRPVRLQARSGAGAEEQRALLRHLRQLAVFGHRQGLTRGASRGQLMPHFDAYGDEGL